MVGVRMASDEASFCKRILGDSSLSVADVLAEQVKKQKASTDSPSGSLEDTIAHNFTEALVTGHDELFAAIIPYEVTPKRMSWQSYKYTCLCGTVMSEKPRQRVAAFDLEDTLLIPRQRFPTDLSHYELWNLSVITKLRAFHDEGMKLLIISNQGGIKEAFDKLIATKVKNLVEWLSKTVDRPIHCILSTKARPKKPCSDTVSLHKPSPHMWKVAEKLCNRGVPFDVENSIFVGDSADNPMDPNSGVDSGFARNVGVKFAEPEEIFGRSSFHMRSLSTPYECPPAHVLETRKAFESGYLDTWPIILLLCGAQGSGKTFFSQSLTADLDISDQMSSSPWVHLSQDTINGGRAGKRQQVELAALTHLKAGKSVIIDRMHLTEDQRKYFIDVGRSAGAPIHAAVFKTPENIISTRVRIRTDHPGGFQGEEFVSIAVESARKLSFPSYLEGFSLINAMQSVTTVSQITERYRRLVHRSDSNLIPSSFCLTTELALPSIALGIKESERATTSAFVRAAILFGVSAIDTWPTDDSEQSLEAGCCESPGTFYTAKVPRRATTATQVRQEVLNNLAAHGRETIDLLLLQWPSDLDTMIIVWKEMEACHKDGIARALGVCNFNPQALTQLLCCCRIQPAVNQVERHILLQQWELVDFCRQHDILLQACVPFGSSSNTDLFDHTVLKRVAAAKGISPTSVVMRWNLQQSVPVVGTCSTAAQLQELVSTFEPPRLTTEEMRELNTITESKRYVSPPFMFGTLPYQWSI